MRKLICLLALAMAVALGAGCAKMLVRGYYMQDTPPQIVPDQESAVVYFLRESAFTGGGITYFIFEDDTKIGLLKSGSYFIHKATPGKHTYLAETESRAAVTLDIPSVQAVLRHKNPNTTARYIKSLGVQPDKIEAAFAKKKGAKAYPSPPWKKRFAHKFAHAQIAKPGNLASPTGFEPVLAA